MDIIFNSNMAEKIEKQIIFLIDSDNRKTCPITFDRAGDTKILVFSFSAEGSSLP